MSKLTPEALESLPDFLERVNNYLPHDTSTALEMFELYIGKQARYIAVLEAREAKARELLQVCSEYFGDSIVGKVPDRIRAYLEGESK